MNPDHSPLITSELPVDQQGFTISFDINSFDRAAVKQFYNKYGLVIFNGVLTEVEIEKSIDDLWNDVINMSKGAIKRKNPSTWDFCGSLGSCGFVNQKPIIQPQISKNRSNPNIYKAFKTLYEQSSNEKVQQPLLAVFDRGSMLRPSKENPKWKSVSLYHFDIYPWWWTGAIEVTQQQWRGYNKYNNNFQYWLGQGNYVPKVKNYTKLQGVLAFSDTNPQSGGFQCVCGFQNYITEWCEKTKQQPKNITSYPQLMANMQKVYQRAGSIILFTRELPHNIYPNISDKFRYAQYLRLAPESSLMLTPIQKKVRQIEARKMIHKEVDLNDPIVQEVYMLDKQNLVNHSLKDVNKKCQVM